MIASFKIDGLELIATGSYASVTIEGLENPTRRVTSYDDPGEDGGTVSASLYGQRAVTVTGLVYGNGQFSVHEANRKALRNVCQVNRDAYQYPILKRIDITTMGGASYFFYAEVNRFQNPVSRGTTSDMTIGLVAPDHRLYLPGLQTTGRISRPSGGGFLMPFLSPFFSGASTGGSATATNAGSIMTLPVIHLRDQLTSPYLINNTTGKAMALNATVSGGSDLVIDMNNKTVMLGTQNYLSTKTTDSDWWGLLSGPNSLGFSTSNTSDTGTVEVTWYGAELGL